MDKDKQKQEQEKKDQAPPPQEPGLGEHHHEHHHGKDAAKKVGNAIMFGAGATAGSDAVQGIVKNL